MTIEVELQPLEKYQKFKVELPCAGCTGRVERVIKRLNSVTNVIVSFEDKTVKVYGEVDSNLVLEAINKTGIKIEHC